jgi:signal transduction histidine kinase
MRIRNFLLPACLFMLCSDVSAQSKKIDILKSGIASAPTPAAKLNAVFTLCEETESLHKDTLYQYAKLAETLALELRSAPALRKAAYYRAYSYYRRNQMDSVLITITEHLPRTASETPGSETHQLFRLLQARYYMRSQEYKEALAMYYSLLSDAEKNRDTLTQIRAMAGIGSVMNRSGDQQAAIDWSLRGIRLGEGQKYRDKTGYLYTNVAAMYNRISKNDSADYWVKKAIALAKETENLADLSYSLGLYAGNLMDIQRYDEAEKALHDAIGVAETMGDPNDILNHMGALAFMYYARSQPAKGIETCKKAIAIIEQYGVGNKLPFIYEMLAKNYAEAGNYQAQAETLSRLVEINDSLLTKNSTEAIAEMNAKFEVQQKENMIIRQQLDLVKKDYLIYSSAGLFIVAAAAGWFIFTGYKKRQRQRAVMAVSAAEETERKRIAADLHDNLGAYAASIASNVNRLSNEGTPDSLALQEVRNHSRAIVSDLSDTIWALKKEELRLTAVSDRLKLFIQRVQPSYPGILIDVHEKIDKEYTLTPSQGFHLFQIIKEAVNNALKHSGADHILIDIRGDEHTWQIQATDNGKGMRALQENSEGGNGLYNMRNRASEAGWQISWLENNGGGVVVEIRPGSTN